MAMRQLSSRATFWSKIVFPLLWSSIFCLGTLWMFTHSVDATGKPLPAFMKWNFLVLWLLLTLMQLWLCGPLKRVRLDGASLRASNFRLEVTVPLSHIASVRENRRAHIDGKHPIIVSLSQPCAFGSKIIFLPTGKAPFAWPWQKKPHPIAAQLQQIAARNRSGPL